MVPSPHAPIAPPAPPDVVRFATAGTFLEGLAAQDFARLATSLAAEVVVRALLPSRHGEWHGAVEVAAQFERWFGDVERFELVDASVGEVADRLHLRWRIRVQAPDRFGPGWFVVEQQVYARTDGDGRIDGIDLLCTGFRPEPAHH